MVLLGSGTRSLRRWFGVATWLACAWASSSVRAEGDGPSVVGDLDWISSDRLNLVGSMAAEVPLTRGGRWPMYLSARAVTAIEKASNFTFLVDHLSYAAQLGARRRLPARGTIEVFAGERGREDVDAVGHVRATVIGAGFETDGFGDAFGPEGWAGRATLGAVVAPRGLDAVADAGATLRWMSRVGGARRISVGLDAAVDALIGNDHGADVLVGPRVEFDLGGERRLGLHAKWLSGRNPLGLGVDGVLAGFDLAQGPRRTAPRRVPPEIAGTIAAGFGDAGRSLARLDLHVASPPFLGGTWAEIEVDANVLTAPDRDDLYYLYDIGAARGVGVWRPGGWFHHRSNHVLGGVNPAVTSINVLEVGVDSAGWNRAEPGVALGRAGALDVRVRLGYLLDSAFGRDVTWNARGGLRWASPTWGAIRLYASAEVQRGDIEGSVLAAGLLLPRSWDLRVEQRHDPQLYSADRRALLGVATLRF